MSADSPFPQALYPQISPNDSYIKGTPTLSIDILTNNELISINPFCLRYQIQSTQMTSTMPPKSAKAQLQSIIDEASAMATRIGYLAESLREAKRENEELKKQILDLKTKLKALEELDYYKLAIETLKYSLDELDSNLAGPGTPPEPLEDWGTDLDQPKEPKSPDWGTVSELASPDMEPPTFEDMKPLVEDSDYLYV